MRCDTVNASDRLFWCVHKFNHGSVSAQCRLDNEIFPVCAVNEWYKLVTDCMKVGSINMFKDEIEK